MTHKSTALQVAGRTVRLVVVDNRLYVPLRFLVEETLDMRWEGQRKRLAALGRRWRMADLLVAGQRKVVQQPCLPVGMVLPYLWLLRPTRPETQALLERLRDGWDAALMACLKLDGSELANIGSFQLAGIGRATLPLLARIGELEKQLAEAGPPSLAAASLALTNARKNEAAAGADTFLEMARLNNDGRNNTEIAAALGISRTTVSLFLNGRYKTGGARDAWDKLAASRWRKAEQMPGNGVIDRR